jgi:hypothetical protein
MSTPPTPADRIRAEEAIAFIAHLIRPAWGRQGLLAAIRRGATEPLERVAAATLYAAVIRVDQRTPDFLPRDGEHWQALDRLIGRLVGTGTPTPPRRDEIRCPIHLDRDPCRGCAADTKADQEPPARLEPSADPTHHIAEIRAALRKE